ncbi:MAG: VWA domain-containing protein, partial [Chloroflexota bacterium]
MKVTFFDSGQQLSRSDSEQILYLLTEIRSPLEEEEKKILPLNIVLVIDRSTSMQGERIDRVKAAASMIVE